LVDNPSFANDLGIDTLDLHEVFMEFENEFEISIAQGALIWVKGQLGEGSTFRVLI
jgi:acyl carrier protein